MLCGRFRNAINANNADIGITITPNLSYGTPPSSENVLGIAYERSLYSPTTSLPMTEMYAITTGRFREKQNAVT